MKREDRCSRWTWFKRWWNTTTEGRVSVGWRVKNLFIMYFVFDRGILLWQMCVDEDCWVQDQAHWHSTRLPSFWHSRSFGDDKIYNPQAASLPSMWQRQKWQKPLVLSNKHWAPSFPSAISLPLTDTHSWKWAGTVLFPPSFSSLAMVNLIRKARQFRLCTHSHPCYTPAEAN